MTELSGEIVWFENVLPGFLDPENRANKISALSLMHALIHDPNHEHGGVKFLNFVSKYVTSFEAGQLVESHAMLTDHPYSNKLRRSDTI